MWRSATGQRGIGLSDVDCLLVPPLWPADSTVALARRGGRLRRLGVGRLDGAGLPAEGERAAHQGVVAVDRSLATDLEVGPAQLVFDLLVALLGPVTQPVAAHHLGQIGRRQARPASVVGVGPVGDHIPGGALGQPARVGAGHYQPYRPVGTPGPEPGVGGPPGFGVPVAEPAGHLLPAAGATLTVPA